MMRKLFIIILLSICCSVNMFAQGTYTVQQFGKNLSNWASGQNVFSALDALENLCSQNPVILIGDRIMSQLAYKNGLAASNSYKWDSYIACMQKEIDKGVSITVSDVDIVPTQLIPDEYRNDKSLYFVSGNIKISGASNFDVNDLFVLKNGKIVKIQNYQVFTDKNGHRRINVDLSDLDLDEDTEGFGVSYNYSKAFPFGASITYSKWKFMIGVDFGINNDKDIYTTQKVYFNNIVDYKIDLGEYDLKYFITVTPSFYMKYFSVGWGVGYAYLKGTKYTKDNSLTVYPDGTTIQTGSTTSVDDFKYKWMMRPTIKGYIPCSDNFFISLSVNYDWIVGYKEKSGIGFGAGIHFLFD